MFETLSEDLLDLRASEVGEGRFGEGVAPAFPICCSIVVSLCSSCSSRAEEA